MSLHFSEHSGATKKAQESTGDLGLQRWVLSCKELFLLPISSFNKTICPSHVLQIVWVFISLFCSWEAKGSWNGPPFILFIITWWFCCIFAVSVCVVSQSRECLRFKLYISPFSCGWGLVAKPCGNVEAFYTSLNDLSSALLLPFCLLQHLVSSIPWHLLSSSEWTRLPVINILPCQHLDLTILRCAHLFANPLWVVFIYCSSALQMFLVLLKTVAFLFLVICFLLLIFEKEKDEISLY